MAYIVTKVFITAWFMHLVGCFMGSLPLTIFYIYSISSRLSRHFRFYFVCVCDWCVGACGLGNDFFLPHVASKMHILKLWLLELFWSCRHIIIIDYVIDLTWFTSVVCSGNMMQSIFCLSIGKGVHTVDVHRLKWSFSAFLLGLNSLRIIIPSEAPGSSFFLVTLTLSFCPHSVCALSPAPP